MNLLQGADSKVNIALYFNDIDLFGLSKAKVYKASGFNEISKLNTIDIRFSTPQLMIVGPYKANGRILVLPIKGNGTSHIILGEFRGYFCYCYLIDSKIIECDR